MTTIPENLTVEGVRFVRATRAERAEAALAACTERCNEHVQEASERAEVAHAKAVALAAERDHWKARAEKAEAAITRMREWRDFHGSGMTAAAREDFDATLDPKPAFTLPTEAGARFTAVDNCGKRSVFEAVHDGPDIHYLNRRTYVIWSGGNVMDYCTDHRMVGADQ